MLKIRLQRVGRRHDPSYRVVLIDSRRAARGGGAKAILGSYDPRQKQNLRLDAEAITAWIGKGAQASGTVHNILVSKGIVQGKKRNVIHAERIKEKQAKEVEKKGEA